MKQKGNSTQHGYRLYKHTSDFIIQNNIPLYEIIESLCFTIAMVIVSTEEEKRHSDLVGFVNRTLCAFVRNLGQKIKFYSDAKQSGES